MQSSYIHGLPELIQTRIRTEYRKQGGSYSTNWNDQERQAMSEAIFVVENDEEHRLAEKGIGPNDPKMAVVRLLNARRNVLLDELGENETQPGLRWPHVEKERERLYAHAKRV